MKALSVHTYLGGMQHGVSGVDDIEMLGSIETWKPALRVRQFSNCIP